MSDESEPKPEAPAKPKAPQPKKLPPEAVGRLQMASLKLELARERFRADVTEIERDYDFRMSDHQVRRDGQVVPDTRPRSIPPGAAENIRKQAPRHKVPSPTGQTPPADPPGPPGPPVMVPSEPEPEAPPLPDPEHGQSNGAAPPG